MSDKAIIKHYHHGGLLEAIYRDIAAIGKDKHTITLEELSFLDEFHLGGAQASERLLSGLGYTQQGTILDIGCGLAGTSRRMAAGGQQKIIAIDLSIEYCQVANHLSHWFNLNGKIAVLNASATKIPLQDNSIQAAVMLHVGMNIVDKKALFTELRRVMTLNSPLAIYDLVVTDKLKLRLPLPFASTPQECHIGSLEEYEIGLSASGFKLLKTVNRKQDILAYLNKAQQNNKQTLSVKSLLKDNSSIKMKNLVDAIRNDVIIPYEIYAKA